MAHDIELQERQLPNGEWERLMLGFKGDDQLPLVMIYAEYRKNRRSRQVIWADCKFTTGMFRPSQVWSRVKGWVRS